MKMMNKFCALMLSVALCAGMAAPAFAYGGEPVEEAEQPVLTSTTDEEDAVTVTDEESGALTPKGNLTLVDDYHTSYSDGSGQQFITLVSKSGNTFYLVIDRNDKGENTVHFMNLVDEADLLSLMEEEDADAYTAEKEAAAQAEQDRLKAEEEAKKTRAILRSPLMCRTRTKPRTSRTQNPSDFKAAFAALHNYHLCIFRKRNHCGRMLYIVSNWYGSDCKTFPFEITIIVSPSLICDS